MRSNIINDVLVEYLLLVLQYLNLDRQHVEVRFQRLGQSGVVLQPCPVFLRGDDESAWTGQLAELPVNELEVFLTKVMMVSKLQQLHGCCACLHLPEQGGGGGYPGHQQHLFVSLQCEGVVAVRLCGEHRLQLSVAQAGEVELLVGVRAQPFAYDVEV